MTDAQNLFVWMVQTILLASAAAALPALFRIRHPRTQIVYCHLMLIACLVIPWVEPWRHLRILVPAAAVPPAQTIDVAVPASTVAPADSGLRIVSSSLQLAVSPPRTTSWKSDRVILWPLAAGVFARICWLMGGLWQTRRYRISALPIYPIPDSVRAASAVVHSNALFCVSSEVPGPVMLGWLAPVVLLPESFLTLDEEAQCGIACHELVHVRRSDWLVAILEEIVAALLWFNPGAWILLGQARLAREQLVDTEAVRLTGAREPYIDALLAIARSNPSGDLAPAPVFLRRRHLTHRMHSLLNEVSMSKLRLWSSYGSISALLAFAAWGACLLLPLTGAPVVIAAEPLPAAPEAQVPAVAESSQQPVRLALQQPQQPRARFLGRPARLGSVSLPSDPYEPVTGSIQNASDPADRGAALTLLERARQHGLNHRQDTPPYKLETTFSADGAGEYSGTGQMTETWLSGSKWLWTANMGAYSVSRTLGFGSAAGEKIPGMLPMPIHMLRNAVFWAITPLPDWQVRTAAIQWKGRPTTCILTSGIAAPTEQTRLWEETEYCVDNTTGLLQVQSIAPGSYTVFSYDRNLQFHGRSMPDRIAIYSNGRQVLDAQLNLTDAGAADESQLRPSATMMAAGQITSTGMWMRMPLDVPLTSVSGLAKPVMVHASVDGQGHVVEEELTKASDPALAQQAMDLVKHTNFGATGTQRQTYVNVRFVPVTR